MDKYQPCMRLYQLMCQELENHKMDKPVSDVIYRLYLEMIPGEVDYLKIKALPNEDFFQAAFLCLLKRMPTEEDYLCWKSEISTKDTEAFQKRLLEALLGSEEAQIKNAGIKNCGLLFENKKIENEKTNPSGRRKQVYDFLRRIYKLLPMQIRAPLKRYFKEVFLKILKV